MKRYCALPAAKRCASHALAANTRGGTPGGWTGVWYVAILAARPLAQSPLLEFGIRELEAEARGAAVLGLADVPCAAGLEKDAERGGVAWGGRQFDVPMVEDERFWCCIERRMRCSMVAFS